MADAHAEDLERRVFGDEIRALRDQHAWTQDDLAKLINFSVSTVKAIESGHRLPTLQQARLLDNAFELPGMFERLYQRQRGIPVSAGFRPFAPHEAEATSLKTFEHSLIPGLFQTADYARTLSEGYPGLSAEDVRELVAARLRRQEILDREPAVDVGTAG